MEMVTLAEAMIANCVFPIVMCFVLIKYMNKMETRHSEETASLREVLERNTLATEELCASIERSSKNNE